MKKKEKKIAIKVIVSILIFAIAIFLSYEFGLFKKRCKDDKCFSEAVIKCKMAKYHKLRDFNYYTYEIKGKRGGKCVIKITLDKMAEGTSIKEKMLFEGKSMVCRVPPENLNATTIENIENFLEYCTGPLKESIYKVIIEKLYGLILHNIGDVVVEMRDLLKTK